MKEQMVYDFTGFEETKTSLSKYLDIDERKISRYSFKHKDVYDTEEFLDEFGITNEKLLEKDLLLASLHVTTNNDDFNSIKKYGLVNLQEAVSLDTPLKSYLNSQGIVIDVKKKEIQYKDKKYDISKKFESVSNPIDAIIRKLYMDFQLNSFFNYKNVLEYGVEERPEFFLEISNLLKKDISNGWKKQNNKCHVVKFSTPLSKITNFTFEITEGDEKNLNPVQLELKKRKWIIKQSLAKLDDDFFYSSMRTCFCYLKPEAKIPYSDIIKIYTPDEYLKEYWIED